MAAALQLFQFLPELGRAVETFFGIVGAGLEDQLFQLPGPVGRLGDLCSADPGGEGPVVIIHSQLLRIAGHEGAAAVVEILVHDQAKGIDVRRRPVGRALVDLRRHVGIGPLAGQTDPGLLNDPGDPKVAQLVCSARGNEDVLRFDIPVDDIELPAVFQGFAQVYAKLEHVLFRQVMLQ